MIIERGSDKITQLPEDGQFHKNPLDGFELLEKIPSSFVYYTLDLYQHIDTGFMYVVKTVESTQRIEKRVKTRSMIYSLINGNPYFPNIYAQAECKSTENDCTKYQELLFMNQIKGERLDIFIHKVYSFLIF